MPIRADAPLRKCTLNLYAEDVAWMEKNYGDGWTERVRQHIHNEVQERRRYSKVRTLGDLSDEQ